MTKLTIWLRIVGVFYLVDAFMMTVVHAPVRTVGPEGILDRASAGDPTARFVLDTWNGFGLEVGAIGAGLLLASGKPELAGGLVWTVVIVELLRGIIYDVYMIARGYDLTTFGVWIVIHGIILVTGVLVIRGRRDVVSPVSTGGTR